MKTIKKIVLFILVGFGALTLFGVVCGVITEVLPDEELSDGIVNELAPDLTESGVKDSITTVEHVPVLSFTKTFGGEEKDAVLSVQQTTDGGYIIAGSTKSFGAGGRDAYLVKTDGEGVVEER